MSLRSLESGAKYFFILSLFLTLILYFYKDKLPNKHFYNMRNLSPPIQQKSDRLPFNIITNKQHYLITPRFEYELWGMVVSITRAGELGDIWHYRRWKDFINVRDICVIWGSNVNTGLYKKLSFKSDTWTCWVSIPDYESAKHFDNKALSNNHLLTNDYLIKKKLRDAEIGDQIHLKGVLADYKNTGNGFSRSTSVTRNDSGNGACETVYLDKFEIIKKANPRIRMLYVFSFWSAVISGVIFLLLFCITPIKPLD
jgi:hypothetical protein